MDNNLLISEYLSYIKNIKQFKDGTIKRKRLILNDYLQYIRAVHGIDLSLTQLKLSDAINYLDLVSKKKIPNTSPSYKDNPTGTLSPGTISTYKDTIKFFYQRIIEVMEYPCVMKYDRFPSIRVEEKEIIYLTEDQIREFMSVSDRVERRRSVILRNKLIILMMFVSGCRISELLSISIDDIDRINKQINIKGKGGKYRPIFINDEVIKLMDEYLEERKRPFINSLGIHMPGIDHDSPYIFISLDNIRYGKMLSYTRVRLIFRNYSNEVDFCVTPHILRHSFAVKMLKSGISIRFIQKMLGHKWITTTQNYLRVTNDDVASEHAKVRNSL